MQPYYPCVVHVWVCISLAVKPHTSLPEILLSNVRLCPSPTLIAFHAFTVPLSLSEHRVRNKHSITPPPPPLLLTSGPQPVYPSNPLTPLPPLITGSSPGGWKCSKKWWGGKETERERGEGQREPESLSIAGQNEWPSVAPKPEGLLAHWWLCSWRPDTDAAKVCGEKTQLPARPPANPKGEGHCFMHCKKQPKWLTVSWWSLIYLTWLMFLLGFFWEVFMK